MLRYYLVRLSDCANSDSFIPFRRRSLAALLPRGSKDCSSLSLRERD